MQVRSHRAFVSLAVVITALALLYLNASSFGVWLESPAVKAQGSEPTMPLQGSTYLPLLMNDAATLADRIGFAGAGPNFHQYPEIRQLHGGWYLNWGVGFTPARPGGIEYAHVIMVHQKLACGEFYHADRVACPYAQPLDYVSRVSQEHVEIAARLQPGKIWFIGNEMDRLDWSNCEEFEADGVTCKPGKLTHTGQSEMLPETYARAYHDYYTIIKNADPTARVGIGGVIQATPLRLQYMTIVWDTYRSLYGTDMPVDIWNVHNFILREKSGEYGAEIPPGLPGNPQIGEYTDNDCTHYDLDIFDQQIRAYRQWMKDRGQQQKPLVVNEYGALYWHKANQPNCQRDFNDAELVHNFMIGSFDYFLNTKDCDLGYAADDCRLVQRWLWFSLDHGYLNSQGQPVHSHANYHGSLYDLGTTQMTDAGRLFSEYTSRNLAALTYSD